MLLAISFLVAIICAVFAFIGLRYETKRNQEKRDKFIQEAIDAGCVPTAICKKRHYETSFNKQGIPKEKIVVMYVFNAGGREIHFKRIRTYPDYSNSMSTVYYDAKNPRKFIVEDELEKVTGLSYFYYLLYMISAISIFVFIVALIIKVLTGQP